MCTKCYKLSTRKFERPPYEILVKEVEMVGYNATARKYGVKKGSTIKKWILDYETEIDADT